MNPHATEQTIAWFRKEKNAKTLDLSPDFQRNYVWQDEEASYLVDTVLNELPFPEVYIRTITDEEGNSKYEVVDGQQRIRSLLRFAAGDFALVGEDVGEKFVGKTFKTLTSEQRPKFWDYKIAVRELGSASDGEIRDLFRRINKFTAKPTAQELRHAHFKGVFIKLMEEIADDDWWSLNRIVTTKEIRRMTDIEFISELFIGTIAGPQNKKDTVDDYYQQHESDYPDKERHSKFFRDTKAIVTDTLDSSALRSWSGKSDFYGLFLAFSEFADEEITSPKKKRIAKALGDFRTKVDVAKRKGAKRAKQKNVRDYVEAVTRAASDIDRRTVRVRIIREIIKGELECRQP